jgi:hypothetical protein
MKSSNAALCRTAFEMTKLKLEWVTARLVAIDAARKGDTANPSKDDLQVYWERQSTVGITRVGSNNGILKSLRT